MAASPAALARFATSAGGDSPSGGGGGRGRATCAVGTLGRSPGGLGRAEQVQHLLVGQLGERGVRAAAPDRRVAGEAALALGPGAELEYEPELVFVVHGHPPRRIDLPRLAVHDDPASRHAPLLRFRGRRERYLGPQLPRVGGIGAEALEALFELELLGEPRRLRAMRHLRRAFGELGEQLRILRVAEQPDALAPRFGELTQLPQGREVVGLVRRADAHACHGQHLGHGYIAPSGNASSVPLTSARNGSAPRPSTMRWSYDMDSTPMVRMAIVSVPSGSVTTLGRFSITPTPRMATCGWWMIGAPAYEPKTPGFVIVNVPRWISSGKSFFVRARSPRSLIARAMPASDSSSARLMTGTMRPQSSATAIPTLTSPR